jgi:RHS repeat-associated protein
MNPDGTSQVDLSNNGSVDHCPNWQHVSTNIPPSVSITSPANGASFTAPATIMITASASDSDGSVSRVDFYSRTSLIGTATSAPYSINWNNVAAGSYSLTARATDNLGATTISNPVNITVNAPPTVSITSPVNGASFTAPGNITITANATDSDGSISRVDFYQGTTLIGSATSSPYTMSWNNVAAGSYSVTARATDNAGATITSTAVSVSVTPAGSCSGPTSGLVACWKFDENGGTTAADSSGYGHQGSLQNGTSWTTGQTGAALNFDGVDDMVVTNGLADVTNNFTLSFWALPSASHEIDSESTSGTSGTSGQRYAFWPTWYDSGHAGAGVSVGTNGVSVYEHAAYYMPATLVYPVTITNWTHITIVYENKQPKLYINGTLVRTGLTSTMDYVHLNPYYIGGQVYGYYAGRMDEVRIYNRALSAGEVSVLANGTSAPNASTFVSQTVPTTMTAGQNYAVSVTMKNTGSNTWTTVTNHNLGSQNPQDNTTWGMARVPLPSSVVTGTTVTYNFTVTAPSTPGTYNCQWRMVQDGVEWFGDFSPNVAVTVNASNSNYYLYTADVRWIVPDQLGTPRMIFDQSGSLANVSRHDYLPFSEELANVGGRTTAQGYTGNDGARQKFTQKERDIETGLDFFEARYYSSTQGRLTSPDPLLSSGRSLQPQSWNRYAYVHNSPLRLVDPSGMEDQDPQKPKLEVTGLPIENPCISGTAGCGPANVGTVTIVAGVATPIENVVTAVATSIETRATTSLLSTFGQYIPTPDTMPYSGAPRGQDPTQFTTGAISYGWGSLGITEDMNNRWYVSVGLGPGTPGLSYQWGTVYDSDGQPATSAERVEEGLAGPSINGSIPFGSGSLNTCCTYGPSIPKGGYTKASGPGVPQFGVSRQHTFSIRSLRGFVRTVGEDIIDLPSTIAERLSP